MTEIRNHIELYPEELVRLHNGATITVTARSGEEITLRVKPDYEGGEAKGRGKTDLARFNVEVAEMVSELEGDGDD